MRAYLLKRLLLMIPTFVGITVITFTVIRLAPGDPVSMQAEAMQQGAVSRQAVEHFRKTLGLDQPIHVQYARWFGRIVRFDFGLSFKDSRPVIDKIGEALPITLLVSGLAIFFAYALAIPLGIYSAVRQHSNADRATTLLLFMMYSLPNFWVALMLILWFGGGRFFDVFPIQGLFSADFTSLGAWGQFKDVAWHLVLPVVCLTYPVVAGLSRYMRSGMLEVIRQDYIRTARAKGLAETRVVLVHAVRNSLIPIVTLLSLYVPFLIGGSVIIERIFGIHGMGLLVFEAILSRDYNVIMGNVTLASFMTMGAMLLSDVLYAVVDPRIRYGEAR